MEDRRSPNSGRSARSGSPASDGSGSSSNSSRGSGGGRGGYRGNNRGYGGGGGGGRSSTVVKWTSTMPPAITAEHFPLLKKEFPSGWNELNDDATCQTYTGPPATSCKERIKVSVNHFPLSQFQLPTKIFHYEVFYERIREPRNGNQDEERKKGSPTAGKNGKTDEGHGNRSPGRQQQQAPKRMPKPVPQLILNYLLQKIYKDFNFYGVVSDLSNNIYSTKDLRAIGVDLNPVVSLRDVDQDILQEDDYGKVQVTIVRSDQDVDSNLLQGINEHLKAHGTWKGFDMDPSFRTVVEQVLNAVVKSFPRYQFLPMGRSNLIKWPTTTAEIMPLGNGVTCWKGISANIGMGWKPYLNVDISHCAFLENKNVLKACGDALGFDAQDIKNWRPWLLDEARSLFKHVKVHYTPEPGKKLAGPITDILNTSISKTYFEFQGKQTSVCEYFLHRYNKRLDPNGPCLILRNKNQVPAELCIIKKGQSYNRKLSELQTREMLKLAKKDPTVLRREINQQMKNLDLNSEVTKAWGLSISNEMLTFNDARVLNAPKLIYGLGTGENEGRGRAVITPGDGTWDINSTSFNFLTPKKEISAWGILVVGQARISEHAIRSFADKMMSCASSKGINFITKPKHVVNNRLQDKKDDIAVARNNVNKLSQIFKDEFHDEKGQPYPIVFVIIPKKNSTLYCHVKQAAELHVGLLTQCVVAQNAEKGQIATIQNILLKVNSKMEGRNYIVMPPLPEPEYVDIVSCPTLIMGADVTHPPPGSTRRIRVGIREKEVAMPSFAAVTGSIDRTGMPFMMDIRAQVKAGKGAAEVIQDLESITLNFLRLFELKTKGPRTPEGIRPRKIIYFRDGVGEGQFPEVLHEEMRQIRNACRKLTDYDGEPYEPKITFVTVQKRHKTRFFCHTANGQIVNAPAGTVVDREIVHQTQNDFYLLSHKGMMGTSRPTRYRVLWDDTGYTADQIQNLTYFLCYMYVRCTKSVKIPAPTYYAHLAASRAKALSDGLEEMFDNIPKLNERLQRHTLIMNNYPMHFV